MCKCFLYLQVNSDLQSLKREIKVKCHSNFDHLQQFKKLDIGFMATVYNPHYKVVDCFQVISNLSQSGITI